ncbi:MAG: aminotransferase class I/II-fold pyridoxal phosphate-dependent enzyme [Burkholderiaceae bacterium]|nr:aminotransferase class I/II-fold pyridoxal phosphate-dependent enzyme [Burkholderiaceae bacterium]
MARPTPNLKTLAPETLAVRAGTRRSSDYQEHSEAMFLTSSFCFNSAEEAEHGFANADQGFIYSRFTNPTVSMFQDRLAALEGGEACIATSSGMAAILTTAMAHLQAGDHVVCSKSVFGATTQLFSSILSRFGITTTYVAIADLKVWQAAVQSNTKLFYLETPSNPLTEIADIAGIAKIAKKAKALFVVDNCFCTPALQKPLALGADVVMPIPDSSRPAALQVAKRLGISYREGFFKNRYIGRTFIMPGQAVRKKSVRQKLNAMRIEFKDKTVLIVDDSIVRGTTSYEIVQMARESGAKKVIFASAAPPVRFPNVYGIDMPTRSELVAYGRTHDEINDLIGADQLIYQSVEDMKKAVQDINPNIKNFEASCFDGNYITGDITEAYLDALEAARNVANNEEDRKSDPSDFARSQLHLHLANGD